MNPSLEIFSLVGRHVVISGGCGLLGPHFARGLLRAGATVGLLDVNASKLGQTVEMLATEFGSAIKGYVCDITDEASVVRTVTDLERSAPIFGLINSAAIDPKTDHEKSGTIVGDFVEYPLENWRLSMEVNITGTFLLSREVCRHLQKRRRGSIVNVASTYGLVAPDQQLYVEGCPDKPFRKPGDYPTSKAAVVGFTKYLAAYYANMGIRVNCLVPGGVFNNHSDAFVQAYSSRTLLGRMAQPTEFDGALVYLMSDASSYVTGTNLVVDGGWTAI